MAVKEPCPNCSNSKTCQNIYRELTRQQGPSVAFRSFAAFLLPLIVFIVVLGIVGGFTGEIFSNSTLGTVSVFLFAGGVSFGSVLLIQLFCRLHDKRKSICTLEGE
jgi:hypothetical protein